MTAYFDAFAVISVVLLLSLPAAPFLLSTREGGDGGGRHKSGFMREAR